MSAKVESFIVSVPAEGNAFAEGNEETVLVKITDEDGLYGIGECVAIPDTTRAMVDQITINFWNLGITDPLETKALYDKVYHRSFYHGRREGVRVIGAITEPTLIRQLVEHIDARAAPPPSGH